MAQGNLRFLEDLILENKETIDKALELPTQDKVSYMPISVLWDYAKVVDELKPLLGTLKNYITNGEDDE